MPILIRHEIVAPYAQAASNAGQFDANKIVADQQFRQQQAAQDEADRQQAQQIQQQQFQQHLAAQAAQDHADQIFRESMARFQADQENQRVAASDQRQREMQQNTLNAENQRQDSAQRFTAGQANQQQAFKQDEGASADKFKADQADLNRKAAEQRNQERVGASIANTMTRTKAAQTKSDATTAGVAARREFTSRGALIKAQGAAIDAEMSTLGDAMKHPDLNGDVMGQVNAIEKRREELRGAKKKNADDYLKLQQGWVDRNFAPPGQQGDAAAQTSATITSGLAGDTSQVPVDSSTADQPAASPRQQPFTTNPPPADIDAVDPRRLPVEQQIPQAKRFAIKAMAGLPPEMPPEQKKQAILRMLRDKGFDLKAIGAL